MPDITICRNENCPIKENCYRYNVKPEKYQSFFLGEFKIDNSGNVSCDYFFNIKNFNYDNTKIKSRKTLKRN